MELNYLGQFDTENLCFPENWTFESPAYPQSYVLHVKLSKYTLFLYFRLDDKVC